MLDLWQDVHVSSAVLSALHALQRSGSVPGLVASFHGTQLVGKVCAEAEGCGSLA